VNTGLSPTDPAAAPTVSGMDGREEPAAFLVVDPGTEGERTIPIRDRLCVGREWRGIDDEHRLLIDDPSVSREHLEILLGTDFDRASIIDRSTNGTRLNGVRIGRGVAAPLKPGDRITVGNKELLFRSDRFLASGTALGGETIRRVSMARMVMAVGDIVGYSTISQYTDSGVVLQSLEMLYGGLQEVLTRHRGTLSDYAGDALFAVWELEQIPDAPDQAVSFALDAIEAMRELAPMMAVRDPDGNPLRMGWGIVLGDTAVSSLTGSLVSVVGDAANLAFRISGLSARDGRADVIVTEHIHELLGDRFVFTEPEDVTVKGRTGTERVYGVTGPRP
jgi:adenylate cyclase